jgi:glycogen(starch) synthase
MRILHVLDHSAPLHSGYTFRTLAILREQRALGWETVQLTTPRQGPVAAASELVDGWTFERTPFVPGAWSKVPAVGRYLDEMRATARRLEALVAQVRPDVLHAHSPVLNALPALSVGRRHGIPVVYEIRACWEDAAVDHGSTTEASVRYRASRAIETYAARRADAVTVICEGLYREFVARGIDARKITVIPNAVDVERFRVGYEADTRLRSQLGLGGATVLGFIGSFYAYEGLDLLLRAVAALRRDVPQLRALLVGGGPQEAQLKAMAHELQLNDVVTFVGRVPQSDVAAYYDLIDVMVYPRRSMRLTEIVTPLKPLEAMAQGRIFVASDVGGHRELVRDGQTGFLFRAGDHDALSRTIKRVLAGREQWDELRRRARRFVESERTWRSSVARYAEVYARLTKPLPTGDSPRGAER